jgi:hypothetical protein
MSFEAREKSDAELKALLYGDAPGLSPDLAVDTTHLKTEETVMKVRNWFKMRGLLAYLSDGARNMSCLRSPATVVFTY